jgi:hypothetical protein
MLDWLTSKIGVLIAVGVLISFVLGFFAWEHSAMTEKELQSVADSIAGSIHSLAGLNAKTLINASFGSEPSQLPPSINGDAYTINVTESMVIIRRGNSQVVSEFVDAVFPFNITNRSFNTTEFENVSASGYTGEHESGQRFFIERAEINVSGEVKYVTLVYWP